jgi:transcriptional regulator
MGKDSLSITDHRNGGAYEIPVQDGSIRAMDLRQIKRDADDFGMMSYDPAYMNTAACRSAITFIDGDAGVLRYFKRRTAHLSSLVPRHALEPDALRGSIDLLILKALDLQPMHGWGIGLRIEQLSKGRLEVNQGSLYPALQRLEHKGLVQSDWQLTENNRRARYYRLTASGRAALGDEVARWKRFAAAIQVVLAS